MNLQLIKKFTSAIVGCVLIGAANPALAAPKPAAPQPATSIPAASLIQPAELAALLQSPAAPKP
ncbi:MAG TPA: hypothetical protein VK793_02520, partial [Steroidobacteraceae bacterium]|nr:hypothetical protein [Steroidobacteraceae bacterium]